ncbi:ABC transporter permease [Candidatus Rariloculus sp.]|uniref:ABC transporter permease n=1 Tax=Candidatus Rariloculus sp. TaxID=3101265 RepID=UPI003D0BD986
MKYLPMLWSNLKRKPLRGLLTWASVVVAFLLFGVLEAVRFALSGGVELAGQDRLISQHKVSLVQFLPLNYLNRVRSLDGVHFATSNDWFGGVYQDDRNQLVVIAVEPESFFDVYHEIPVSEEEQRAWQANQTGAVVGRSVAERFGWAVGDVVPIRSNIFTRRGGGDTWELEISTIFDWEDGDNSAIYMHYDYLNEAREFAIDEIGWLVLRLEDPDLAPEVAAAVDSMFANSFAETRTTTEEAFVQGFANQIGNIGAIVSAVASAVFFTMLLVTANAMAQSVRERVGEIAVLRTLGFSNLSVTLLVLLEGLAITVLGAAAGLWLGYGVTEVIGANSALQQFLPLMEIPRQAFVTGALLAAGLGVLASVLPCVRVLRLEITDELRQV